MHATNVCVYFMYSVHTLIQSSLNRAYTHERLRFVAFTNYMPGTHLLPTANWHWRRGRSGRSKSEGGSVRGYANFGQGFFNLRLLEWLLAGREIVCKNILIELSPRFLCCFRFVVAAAIVSYTHTHTRTLTHTLAHARLPRAEQFLLISLFVELLTLI